VLAVSPRMGVVLGPGESSVFEQKFDDYARGAVLGERRDLERVLTQRPQSRIHAPQLPQVAEQ
jgi:hypothetical protein